MMLRAALGLLHRAGWVHRDISKGNIMVDDSGHARLADLEYAKLMDDENIPDLQVVCLFVDHRVYESLTTIRSLF